MRATAAQLLSTLRSPIDFLVASVRLGSKTAHLQTAKGRGVGMTAAAAAIKP